MKSKHIMRSKDTLQLKLRQLSNADSEVRVKAVARLGILLEKKRVPPELISAFDDIEELVRIEVAETLGIIGDKSALPVLWKKINDSSPLVRREVAIAIGLLGNSDDARKLEEKLKNEKNATSKLGFYYALYRLGNDAYLLKLFQLFKSKQYRIRCAAANILVACLDDRLLAHLILSTLQEALKDEPTIAAKSSLTSSIKAVRSHIKKLPKQSFVTHHGTIK